MRIVPILLTVIVLAGLVAAPPMTSAALSGKIAKVQRAVVEAVGAGGTCLTAECAERVVRDKLRCLASTSFCTTALAAILPSVPSLPPRQRSTGIPVEEPGLSVHTTATDPPPPRTTA